MLTNIKITLLLTILLFVSSCSNNNSNNIDGEKAVENNVVINWNWNKNKSLWWEVISSGSVNESIYNWEETKLPSSPNFIK